MPRWRPSLAQAPSARSPWLGQAPSYSSLLTDASEESFKEADGSGGGGGATPSVLFQDGSDQPGAQRAAQDDLDKLGAQRAAQKELYRNRLGMQDDTNTWCREHYLRCPKRKVGEPNWKNLYGLLMQGSMQGIQILVLIRCLTVYDEITDVLVTSDIDRTRDPAWFIISCTLLALPILLKSYILKSPCIRKIQQQLNRAECIHPDYVYSIAVTLYCFFCVVFFALCDVYLLFMYPWNSPTDADFYGTLERLSPLIETFIEGTSQVCFQLYMYVRLKQLDRQVDTDIRRMLLVSILPAVLNICNKCYDLWCDASAVEMAFCEYFAQLIKGPLGFSAPLLTLLNKREHLSYAGFGELHAGPQRQIFALLGPSNKTLREIIFDDNNRINIENLARAIKHNDTLEFVGLGASYERTVVMSFLTELAFDADGNYTGSFSGNIGIFQRELNLDDLRKARTEASFFGLTIVFDVGDGVEKELVFDFKPLGMTFENRVPLVVSKVASGGLAEQLGLKIGWLFKSVDSKDVTACSFEEALDMIKAGQRLLPEKPV